MRAVVGEGFDTYLAFGCMLLRLPSLEVHNETLCSGRRMRTPGFLGVLKEEPEESVVSPLRVVGESVTFSAEINKFDVAPRNLLGFEGVRNILFIYGLHPLTC